MDVSSHSGKVTGGLLNDAGLASADGSFTQKGPTLVKRGALNVGRYF